MPERSMNTAQQGTVRPESHRQLTGASPVMVTTRRPCSRRPVLPGDRMCWSDVSSWERSANQ